jgi:hypothetical protein
MRRRFVILAVAAIALGVGCLVYRGPGRAIVRGHVGDAGATMLVYALIGLAFTRVKPWQRAVATMVIATGVELGQLVWHASSTAGELIIGATFDGWDFVAYIAGTLVSIAWDRAGPRGSAVVT